MQVEQDQATTGAFLRTDSAVDIPSANSQSACAWSLADEAMAPAITAAFDSQNPRPLAVVMGVNISLPIISMPFTFMPAHIEDALLGSVNTSLHGDYKVWMIVPPGMAESFEICLVKQSWL